MSLQVISEAPVIWRLLNGVVCVYKPAGESCNRVRASLLGMISNELCQLKQRTPRKYVSVDSDQEGLVSVKSFDNFADNPLVSGPKYEANDFKCCWSTILGKDTAGVLVLGLNNGTKTVYKLHKNHPMRVYHVKGTFGYVTDNLYKTGKILQQSSFKKIKLASLETVLNSVQASHQRNMYELCGVDIQSQAAFELAAKGLIRPESSKIPIIYFAKCVHFDLPDFTIELHCINEYEAYLKELIHSIGLRMRSLATCTGIQCIRHSYFSLEHALLKKHWTLEYVIENMGINKKLMLDQGNIQPGLIKYTQRAN